MHQCIKFIYFRMALYMFRTVFPSIIRSTRPYIQQKAVSSICLTHACCCMYGLVLLMMEGKTVRNM